MTIYYPNKTFFKSSALVWYDYLLTGFKQLTNNVKIVDYLAKESKSKLNNQVTAIDIEIADKKRRIWYDWCDFHKVHIELIKKDDLYFKIMLLKGYELQKNLLPIGQTTSRCIFIEPNKCDYIYDISFNGRTTNYALRVKAVELIKSHPEINSNVCLRDYISGSKRPPFDIRLKCKNSLTYGEFMNMINLSKLNLALPGVGGDWTWRHTEILEKGGCLLTTKPFCLLPDNPKDIYIEVNRDLRDLIDKIKYFIKHDKEREEIAKRGKKYYEEYLSPKGQAKWILNKIL